MDPVYPKNILDKFAAKIAAVNTLKVFQIDQYKKDIFIKGC